MPNASRSRASSRPVVGVGLLLDAVYDEYASMVVAALDRVCGARAWGMRDTVLHLITVHRPVA